MTEEVIEEETLEPEVEQQEDATEQDDSAAFEDAFAKVRGDDSLEISEPAEPEPQPPVENKIAGLSEDEVGTLLAKVKSIDDLQNNLNSLRDRAFGKIGELNRNIQNIQQAPQINGAISADKLTKLRELDPEVAEAFAADLSGYIGQPAQTSVSNEHIDSIVSQRLNQISRGYEEKLLAVAHPDYQQVTKTEEFNQWLGLKDANEQQTIVKSQDAVFVSNKLNEFKNWRDNKKQPNKQERLKRAVVPDGVVSDRRELSDEEAFLAGFKKARGA